MALEDLTGPNKFITALVNTNPLAADDRREGDDHIRGIKNVLHNTFPVLDGAVPYNASQMVNVFDNAVLQDGSRPMEGPLLLPDGTQAAPALAFQNEPGMGMYRPVPDGVNWVGGSDFTFENCRAWADAFILGKNGDGSTGVYSQAAQAVFQVKAGSYLGGSYVDGALVYTNGARTTTIQNGAGDFVAAGNVFVNNGGDVGMGLINAGAYKYLRFTTDSWRWQFTSANGNIDYIDSGGAARWGYDAQARQFHVDGNYSAGAAAPQNLAFSAEGYAVEGGSGNYYRNLLLGNPNWSDVYLQVYHAQGQWAGMRLIGGGSGNSVIEFRVSGPSSTVVAGTFSGTATNAVALGGRGAGEFIHDNGTGNPEYIRNSGTTSLVCNISGSEFGWGIGPSDARLKHSVQPSQVDPLAAIAALQFVEFRFGTLPGREGAEPVAIDDGRLHAIGLIAQQAQAVLPDLVNDAGTWLGLNAQELAMLGCYGVQRLMARLDQLQARVAELERLASGV